MKKIFYSLVLLTFMVYSQPDSISLKKYCPTKLGQEGALCFAYAPVYTALSIEHNVLNEEDNENSPGFKIFSYGFVASKVKQEKSFWGRLFNRCGRGGTARLALGVLLKTGTVLYSDFPDNCSTAKLSAYMEKAKQFKIKDTSEISNSNPDIHLKNIKRELVDKKPVITTIYQEKFFYNNNGNDKLDFPDNYIKHTKNANHVVCIVGYNDKINGGSFLVKNNYKAWGKNGFSYIRYADFFKLIRKSYIVYIN